ncbi:hypothetical protein [Pseudalkalibacillus salsuginis]|uniref:hypothetical protein n=1 Tax=Pseudalkalibacillus salsuginis TaxID=2910972 RepID=UPI001F46043C|nr:hypothetical protein [Pseudalkalibacillus salsuginis]MCF6409822.1 hypothetical protein [Pseudalkalibacillus salsuginis]
MDQKIFNLWMVVIAIISVFTGEIVTFMMLYLVIFTLREINKTIRSFYEDWKNTRLIK